MKFELDIDKKHDMLKVIIQAPQLTEEVTAIIEKLESSKVIPISGKSGESIFVLDPNEIYYFYAQGRKVYANTCNQSFEVKQKLYELENILPKDRYIRISKSAIVNIYQIQSIDIIFNGSLVVKFDNSKEEIISRRYVNSVKNFIGIGGIK